MPTPKVDEDKCIGCGTCVSICPDVFELNEQGKAIVKDPAGCAKCNCQEAVESCPVDAITLK